MSRGDNLKLLSTIINKFNNRIKPYVLYLTWYEYIKRFSYTWNNSKLIDKNLPVVSTRISF
jgi:hypothetical protein